VQQQELKTLKLKKYGPKKARDGREDKKGVAAEDV